MAKPDAERLEILYEAVRDALDLLPQVTENHDTRMRLLTGLNEAERP